MFVVFAAIFIIGITARHSDENLSCPFTDENGDLCTRSEEFLEKIDEGIIKMNVRPDFSPSHMTEIEKKENRLCCYEPECLKQCGKYLKQLNEDVWPIFLRKAVELARSHPHFFKNNRRNMNDENLKRHVEEWTIKLVHFYLSQNDLNTVNAFIGRIKY